MTIQKILSRIAQKTSLPENLDEYLNSFDRNCVFVTVAAVNGLEIETPEELDHIEELLELNFSRAKENLSYEDFFESAVLDTISQDAFSLDFDEEIIRKAISLGLYPMAGKIDVLNIFSVRHHNKKLIITPESFRVPHNVKSFIEKKFSDYTLTFNKAFTQCIEEIRTAYPVNWLVPDLTDVFEIIHKNPDEKISMNSVEIWHDGKLVAGEIGFISGNAYASLSGFHKENDIGNVQMALLGKYLFENGFAFWDLGMIIPYKFRYGAFECDRKLQKDFYDNIKNRRLSFTTKEIKLSDFLKYDLSCRKEEIDFEHLITFSEPNTKWAAYGRQIVEITDYINMQILYSAYMQGVFPWFSEEDGEPVTWYSTDPRFVLMPEDFHCPKSLKKFLKKSPYTYTMDKCFHKVIEECAKMKRQGQNGTWIGNKMINVYTKFHKAGFAHSFEVWHDGKLAGGFYGVLIGSVFFGESMFTLEPDSSKSAFAFFMQAFKNCGGTIVDSQSYTENIARYGGKNISRDAFLRIEKEALYKPLSTDFKSEFQNIVKSHFIEIHK